MGSPNQKLDALKVLWERKRGVRAMPSRANLDVTELKPWLGNLALIDLFEIDGGTIRLCGTSLFRRFGRDVTGCDVRMLSSEVGASICACIARVHQTMTVIGDRHMRIIDGKPVMFDDLAFPLSDDGAHVTMLLFASYPAKAQ